MLDVCEHYNHSKAFEAFGFGAKIPPGWEVSHLFPLVCFRFFVATISISIKEINEFRTLFGASQEFRVFKALWTLIEQRFHASNSVDQQILSHAYTFSTKNARKCHVMAQDIRFFVFCVRKYQTSFLSALLFKASESCNTRIALT